MLKNQVTDKDLTAVRSGTPPKNLPKTPRGESSWTPSRVIWISGILSSKLREKIKSLDLNKQAHIEGTLIRIEGQFMIFENSIVGR